MNFKNRRKNSGRRNIAETIADNASGLAKWRYSVFRQSGGAVYKKCYAEITTNFLLGNRRS